jgi:hypothetical protein
MKLPTHIVTTHALCNLWPIWCIELHSFLHSFIHPFVHPTNDSPLSIHTPILPPSHPSNNRLTYIHHSPTQAPPNHPNVYPNIYQFFHKSTYLPVLYFVRTYVVSGNYMRSASTRTCTLTGQILLMFQRVLPICVADALVPDMFHKTRDTKF